MKRMAVTGFIIWLVATIALRFGGQYIFGRVPALLLLLITLPVMYAVAIIVVRPFRARERRALAAIALVAPGMLLDTFSAIWFPLIDYSGLFGGWLLFCDVVVLLTAISTRPSAA